MNLHLIIRGVVQGVGYRQWLRRRALDAGLAGWARNRADGTVEAVLSGPSDKVEMLVAAAMCGPPGARVEAVDRREDQALHASDPGRDFVVLPTI
jgi:acylphosphatase